MENLIDSFYYEIARESHPVASEIYGIAKVAMMIKLMDSAEVPPEIACEIFESFFPMSEQEYAEEEEAIHRNEVVYKLLFPEESKREEQIVMNVIENLKKQGII